MVFAVMAAVNWLWDQRTILLGEGGNERVHTVCLPGQQDPATVNPCPFDREEEEGDSLYDLHRLQGQYERYQKLLVQVETLQWYGIENLKSEAEGPERIKSAIEKAKKDDYLLKRAIIKFMAVNGRHYNSPDDITDPKNEKLYATAKSTVLEFLESAAEDLIEEVEGNERYEYEEGPINLEKLRNELTELAEDSNKQVRRMEAENGWTQSEREPKLMKSKPCRLPPPPLLEFVAAVNSTHQQDLQPNLVTSDHA